MREIAEEWGGPIAAVRNAPPEWQVLVGSGSSDGQAHGCSSTLIPQLPDRDRYIIVTAPDEHWATVTDLVLRPPASFRDHPNVGFG